MVEAGQIPAEIMAEARRVLAAVITARGKRLSASEVIARAILTRDTAARKECAEIAWRIDNECGMEAGLAAACAEAIEATIGGGNG